MSTTTLCLRCGGDRIIRDKSIRDGGKGSTHTLYVTVGEQKPEAFVFTHPVTRSVAAAVCADCGHVDLSVDNPGELWTEYQKLSPDGGGPDPSEGI
ncbi:MAG: hypothetical protein ACI9WU_001057 [Myxococcota bacterium]|jgi:hypothetical protein